jgi:hypothetical protein
LSDDLPKYFQSADAKSVYKISKLNQLEEIQIVGNKAFYFLIEAKQYPEMLMIQDMLANKRPGIAMGNFKELFDGLKIQAKK